MHPGYTPSRPALHLAHTGRTLSHYPVSTQSAICQRGGRRALPGLCSWFTIKTRR